MNWLPNSGFELGWLIYHNVSTQLQTYTRGVMLQSLIMAVFCSIGFSLVGLDIPLLMGAITGLFNLVPYIGPVISILLALLVGFSVIPYGIKGTFGVFVNLFCFFKHFNEIRINRNLIPFIDFRYRRVWFIC